GGDLRGHPTVPRLAVQLSCISPSKPRRPRGREGSLPLEQSSGRRARFAVRTGAQVPVMSEKRIPTEYRGDRKAARRASRHAIFSTKRHPIRVAPEPRISTTAKTANTSTRRSTNPLGGTAK